MVGLTSRSAWSTLGQYKTVAISKYDGALSGHIRVPGSKSLTNRALIMASVAAGPTTISGILKSDDSYWCIDSLKKLGIEITVDGDVAYVAGSGGSYPVSAAEIFIGSAGTTARFLPGVVAAMKGGHWTVKASQQLMERPIAPLIDALRTLGADIGYADGIGYYPLQIHGQGLTGGKVSISGELSSQFISGLIMAAPLAHKSVNIRVTSEIVQHAYVQLTIDLMRQFGVEVEHDSNLTYMNIEPQTYQGRVLALEADASTAGYFMGLAALTGGTIRITNLGCRTTQPDMHLLDIFQQMGCRVVKDNAFVEVTGVSQLKGGFTVSMKEMSDQTLTLAAIAPFADGPITITNVAHIRKHESDRIHAMFLSLQALGIDVMEHEDGLTIHPGCPKPAELDTHDDHRLAMSLALIGVKAGGVTLRDPGCISKTCPTFFDDIERLGVKLDYQPAH